MLYRRLRPYCLALAWLLSAAIAAGTERATEKSGYLAALNSIDADELSRMVGDLASNALEGREAGSRGGRAAGDYVAQYLAQLHLKPAGRDGSFFQPFVPNFRNVLAVVPGSDPEASEQYVVVGAHYDHVGYGTERNSRGPVGYVHPGADDNASGTSGLLEVAKALSTLPESPRRSILLIGFDAEEKGLFGSKYWTAHPTVPLDRVVMMINMDMIGRLHDNTLTIQGVRTAYGLRRLLSEQNERFGLRLHFDWTLDEEDDCYPFATHEIPTILLNTGLHDEYHTPRDKAKLINEAGLTIVARYAFALAYEVAQRAESPHLRRLASHETEETRKRIEGRVPVVADRLGIAWSAQNAGAQGVEVARVAADSVAARAGIQPGDHIVQFAGTIIHDSQELRDAVRTAQNSVTITLQRPGREEPVAIQVELGGTPMRLGITWRLDDAEPGALILTYVAPDSPAAEAGLKAGDRIYQIDGEEVGTEAQFGERVRQATDSVNLLIERDGQLLTVDIHFRAAAKRAA